MEKRGVKVLLLFVLIFISLASAQLSYDNPNLPRVIPPAEIILFSNESFNQSLSDLLYWRLDGTNAPPTANWDMGGNNFTNVGFGFFNFLGSAISRITKAWFTDIDVSNNIQAETINATNISSTGFEGFGIMPIGSIIAWAGNLSGVPVLPDGWVMANGQNLSDSQSPLNGIFLPNLNGNNSFLRGNQTSSGDEGGQSTVALTVAELAEHRHPEAEANNFITDASTQQATSTLIGATVNTGKTGNTGVEGSGTAHENKPPYFDVIWIIRIKLITPLVAMMSFILIIRRRI